MLGSTFNLSPRLYVTCLSLALPRGPHLKPWALWPALPLLAVGARHLYYPPLILFFFSLSLSLSLSPSLSLWAIPPVRLGLSGRSSGRIPERPRKRSQSVSWNFPREYGWDAPNPIIQGIWGFQSVSRILSPPVRLGTPLFPELVPERASQSWSWNPQQYWGYFWPSPPSHYRLRNDHPSCAFVEPKNLRNTNITKNSPKWHKLWLGWFPRSS